MTMKRNGEERNMRAWLFNPSIYLAGWEALFLGLAIILMTSYVGSWSNTHFDGVLDTHSGMPAPWWCFLAEGMIDWLSMAIVLWIIGKCVSKTSFRSVDLFGTQAVARWPMLITSLLCALSPFMRFTEFIMWKFGGQGEAVPFRVSDAVIFASVVLAMLVITCWAVYLMYKAYSVACNIKGGKAIGTFVGGLVLGEIVSKAAIIPLIIFVQQDQSWKPGDAEAADVAGPPPAAVVFQHEKIYTFDNDEGIEKVSGDQGMTVSVTNGQVRIHGTTTDSDWGPEAVKVPVTDRGGSVDVSGKFTIEEREASGLVFLEAETQNGGPLIYMYQWSPGFKLTRLLEAYQIQTRWYNLPARLVNGVKSTRAPGDPKQEFCSMRIHIREDHKTVDFYANSNYQDTVVFEEPFGLIVKAKMELQTPRKGYRFDIRFDDLAIKWNDPVAAVPSDLMDYEEDITDPVALNALQNARKGVPIYQADIGFRYLQGNLGVARNTKRAAKWIRLSADAGCSAGEYYLSLLYKDGIEVKKDDALASQWLDKSAKQKNPYAVGALAMRYQQGDGVPQDDSRFHELWWQAAEFGHPQAQFHRGQDCEQRGKTDEARTWYERSVQGGYEEAKAHLQRLQ